jgi:dephospho-CoA kinase
LIRGLAEFGIVGAFTSVPVSHDELDAITSALVGVFFWAGRFEGLGNAEEDYLIIPEIASGDSRWKGISAIGLSGPMCSGKTTAGAFLKERGYHYGRYSQVIENIARRRGLTPSRAVLQQIGIEVNQQFQGQRWLGRQLLSLMPTSVNLVIDGLRHPADHAFLIETLGPDFMHLNIVADRNIRMLRYLRDGHTEDEFERASTHLAEAGVPGLAELAHATVTNNSDSIDSFAQSVFAMLKPTPTERKG